MTGLHEKHWNLCTSATHRDGQETTTPHIPSLPTPESKAHIHTLNKKFLGVVFKGFLIQICEEGRGGGEDLNAASWFSQPS